MSKLFVTVQESTDDISSSLTIYSLRFPPATFEEHPRQRNEFAQLPTYAFLLLPASAVVLLLLGAAFRRSRQRRNRQQPPTADAVEEKTPLAPYEEKGNEAVSSSPSDISSHMSGEEAFAPNSVYLFGEFTMIDRNRHNISYLCTARVKQIFCLILRHSNSNGISSKQLSDLLWPDKPKDKVKNSRGVTINHLRKVLSELDGIELVYEKGCFRFVLSDDFHCDYQRGMEIIHSGKENECKQEFLRIIGRGKFLHSLDDPIFDSFKQDVECRLEDVLLKQIEEAFNAQDYPSVITLSEAEFGIDPLSERTLYYHLKSLFMLKRENAAITSYQKFIAKYKKCTGKDYPQSFRHYWC